MLYIWNKILVFTDLFEGDKKPHLVLTALENIISDLEGQVTKRESKYNDVAGMIFTVDGDFTVPELKEEMQRMGAEDLIRKLADEIDKDMVCAVRDNYGHHVAQIFRRMGDPQWFSANIRTHNDVNYDVWLAEDNNLWDPIECLFEVS